MLMIFCGSDSKNIEKSENVEKLYFLNFSDKFYLQSLKVSLRNSQPATLYPNKNLKTPQLL